MRWTHCRQHFRCSSFHQCSISTAVVTVSSVWVLAGFLKTSPTSISTFAWALLLICPRDLSITRNARSQAESLNNQRWDPINVPLNRNVVCKAIYSVSWGLITMGLATSHTQQTSIDMKIYPHFESLSFAFFLSHLLMVPLLIAHYTLCPLCPRHCFQGNPE